MKNIQREIYAAIESGDKKRIDKAYKNAVQEYADRIAIVVGPLDELMQPLAIVALRFTIAAYESDLNAAQKKFADDLLKAGEPYIRKFKLPDYRQ